MLGRSSGEPEWRFRCILFLCSRKEVAWTMPKKMSQFVLNEQPINWARAFIAGGASAIFMMAFIDSYYLMGMTPFTYEIYIGSLLLASIYGHQNWTVGWFANIFIGGLFGILYAYFFEYVFVRSSARLGTLLGFLHSIL